ncbi:MAG: hypothetical protein HYX53_17610 [Chloroflexi bacterium]|nr:hypothetical protein [Chloroflexota bacterium]
MTRVDVHIEELVLRGFDPRQRHAIADALQAELARLFAESAGGSNMPGREPLGAAGPDPRADPGSGSVSLEPGTPGAVAGARLAAAVHAAILPAIAREYSAARQAPANPSPAEPAKWIE